MTGRFDTGLAGVSSHSEGAVGAGSRAHCITMGRTDLPEEGEHPHSHLQERPQERTLSVVQSMRRNLRGAICVAQPM
eukprot:4947753-Pyramimonas_sp.AAC.1